MTCNLLTFWTRNSGSQFALKKFKSEEASIIYMYSYFYRFYCWPLFCVDLSLHLALFSLSLKNFLCCFLPCRFAGGALSQFLFIWKCVCFTLICKRYLHRCRIIHAHLFYYIILKKFTMVFWLSVFLIRNRQNFIFVFPVCVVSFFPLPPSFQDSPL